MTGPIEELLASEELRKDGWLRIASSQWESTRMTLDVVIHEGDGGPTRARWHVGCDGVREFRICDVNGGGLRISGKEHPAVRQYLDRQGSLLIQGTPADPSVLVGSLWLAHRRLVDDWIEFDRYLTTPLDESLANGCGKIAKGPHFLLEQYAGVIRDHGVEATSVPIPPEHGERPGELFMLHFGASYVVAERFSAEQVIDR